MKKDYSPIIKSFLHQIKKVGFIISKVQDECGGGLKAKNPETGITKTDRVVETLMSTDGGSVTFQKGAHRITAQIILGNDADELVADWSFNSLEADSAFEAGWDAFRNVWEGKSVPTMQEGGEG